MPRFQVALVCAGSLLFMVVCGLLLTFTETVGTESHLPTRESDALAALYRIYPPFPSVFMPFQS